MTDYYSILGVSKTANVNEIKNAFRKLAKIYHPDKNPDNPDAKHVFQNILKAYNTLIHPSLKRRYDLSHSDLASLTTKVNDTKRKTQKEWTFTEEELERRKYYEKHYKAKQKEKETQTQLPITVYSDYKYILFATPIAIALFMFLISIFTETPPTHTQNPEEMPLVKTQNVSVPTKEFETVTNTNTPYSGYFGGVKTYTTTNSLQITNTTKYDAVIVVYHEKTDEYLQHAYIKTSFTVVFNKLPTEGVYWKCMLGKNWEKHKLLNDKEVKGGFDSIMQYQNNKQTPINFINNSETTYELQVFSPQSKNKKMISNEAEFFHK